MNLSVRWLVLMGFAICVFSGCGTIFTGTSQNVSFKTDPENVKIYIDGVYKGTTPIELTLKRETFREKILVLKKDGYVTQQTTVKKTLNAISLINCTSVTSWGIDMLTGAMVEYSPGHYYIELEPKGGALNETVRDDLYARYFFLNNLNKVMADIVAGKGEYLDALCGVYHIPAEKAEQFRNDLTDRVPELMALASPGEIADTVKILADQLRNPV